MIFMLPINAQEVDHKSKLLTGNGTHGCPLLTKFAAIKPEHPGEA
jgi:hypothetical protein